MGYNLITNQPMLMKHQAKNINLLLHIYQFYNCDASFGQYIGYNHDNNFVQTLNAVFSVIIFWMKMESISGDKQPMYNNMLTQQLWDTYLNLRAWI